jgi:hypothetical protein
MFVLGVIVGVLLSAAVAYLLHKLGKLTVTL